MNKLFFFVQRTMMTSFQRFYFFLHHWRSSLPIPEKSWQSPPSSSFKLNVDGALSLNYGLHGIRAVVRNSYGHLCGVVVMCAPSQISVLATEFYALKIGIFFAVDASFSPLLVESDSLSVIQFLLKEKACYAAEWVLIDDVWRLFASSSSLSVCFVPHTANGVANRLAHFSLYQEDFILLVYWSTTLVTRLSVWRLFC